MLESVVAQIAPKLNISRRHSVLLRLFPHARRALLIDKLLKWFNIISLYWRSGGQPRQQSSESIASRGCIWVRAQAELSLWKKMCTAQCQIPHSSLKVCFSSVAPMISSWLVFWNTHTQFTSMRGTRTLHYRQIAK